MGAKTEISWSESTWNPIRGCTRLSPGCGGPGPHGGCYAEAIAARFSGPGLPYEGIAEMRGGKPRWTGKLALVEDALTLPLRWRKPRLIFVNSMSDLFHESVPEEWIDRVFAVMALAPQHTFQVLSKRSTRLRAYLTYPLVRKRIAERMRSTKLLGLYRHASRQIEELAYRIETDEFWPLRNVWLGVSAEDQRRADERVPDLLATPAAARFVSAEPLLSAIDFTSLRIGDRIYDALQGGWAWGSDGAWEHGGSCARLGWLIVGGESGSNARPMHPAWARQIRDDCAGAGVAFHFKQWGAWGLEHPDWPRVAPNVMAADGTLYGPEEIAYPDGSRRGEAIRKDHGHAQLTSIYRVGKKHAGRLLDGRAHDAMPGDLS